MVIVVVTVASGLVFADTGGKQAANQDNLSKEVNFTAKLDFDSSMDNQVSMRLTNYGSDEMTIAAQAHYIDNQGSAGSWDCEAKEDCVIDSGKNDSIDFRIERPVSHGDNSILAFFFQYRGEWYLGKVGRNNGIEFYLQHD